MVTANPVEEIKGSGTRLTRFHVMIIPITDRIVQMYITNVVGRQSPCSLIWEHDKKAFINITSKRYRDFREAACNNKIIKSANILLYVPCDEKKERLLLYRLPINLSEITYILKCEHGSNICVSS